MKKIGIHIILCCVLCTIKNTYCQTPSYYQYETSNGLPSNEVYDVKQDQQGFLWLGTEAGLVKYDGTGFKLYNNNQSRGNAISCLREDKFGRIWCTNFSGQIFYINADSLALFIPFEKLYKTNYAEIDFDIDGNLIVTSGVPYLYRYNIITLKCEVVNSKENAAVFYPYKTYNNDLIFSSLMQPVKVVNLKKYNQQSLTFEFENGKQNKNYFVNKFIFTNSFKSKQTLCFQVFNPINLLPLLFNYNDKKIVFHPVSKLLQKLNAYPQTVYDDDDGNLLVGTSKQLLWFKKTVANNWNLFATMFIGNSISCIRKDREGNLWIATLKNGIYKISNANIYSLNLESIKAKSIGVNHLATNANNNIYGSNLSGEIFDFSIANKSITVYNTPEERDVQTLKYNPFNKNLFVCKGAAFYINPSSKAVVKCPVILTNTKDLSFAKNSTYYKAGGILEVIVEKNNSLAIQNILNSYDTIYKDYYFKTLDKLGWQHIVLKEQRCKAICYMEDEKVLYVGFVDGLAFIKNKKYFDIREPQTNKPIIASQFIYDSSSKKLYVASIKQGIFVIKDEKIIQHINTSNGLYSNNIKRFRVYKNNLWMVSENKIQSYHFENKQVKTIDMQDGLLSNELYDVEILRDTVYVASSKGVQYFPTNIQTKNSVAPVSMIQSFIVDGSLYNSSKPIALGASTKNILINLEGIALKSNGVLKYQYRLLPNDTNWITVLSSENIVRYSSLSSNDYTFESRVLNEDNIASNNTSKIRFTINKPWWLQWWFLFLATIFLMLGSFFVYQYQANKKQKKLQDDLEKSKLAEELRRSQLASLKSQMNPHFMFNALNSIQEFIILNNKEQANMYMGKFADLMRLTLDMSNKDEVILADELKVLNLYLELEALRFEDKFAYQIYLDNKIDVIGIYLPPMLIQPYVENAIKHGLLHRKEDKKLEISFVITQQNILTCTIKDNGIGRKRSMEMNALRKQKHTSFATGATQKRLELLNTQHRASISVVYSDLIDANNNAMGTEVVVNIPFSI